LGHPQPLNVLDRQFSSPSDPAESTRDPTSNSQSNNMHGTAAAVNIIIINKFHHNANLAKTSGPL